MEIKFNIKPFIPNTISRPVVLVNFKHNSISRFFVCIIDSGADFCTLPLSVAKNDFFLNLEEKTAPYEIKKKWDTIDKSNQEELNNFLDEITRKDFAIPTITGCACGRKPEPIGYLFPMEIEIGKFTNKAPILFLDCPPTAPPLLGRIGVFDQFDEIVFRHKTGDGYFSLKNR